MKKLKNTMLLAAGAMLLGSSSLMAGTDMTKAEIEKDRAQFPKMLQNKALTVVKAEKEKGFNHYEFEAKTPRGVQKFEVFTIGGENPTMFIGKAFDKNGKPVNLKMNNKAIEDGVAFTMGKGPEIVYLVTDPQCPYCQRLESSVTPEALEKITIKVIPMPLSFHNEAKPMLYWVLAAPTKAEQADRMHKVMTGDTAYKSFKPTAEQKAKFDAIIEKSQAAATELGARGTPSLYDENFNQISPGVLTQKPKVKTTEKIVKAAQAVK